MLRSMTGYGEATRQCGDTLIAVELRTINHRYVRVSLRCDGYVALESRAEELVRKVVRRGAVQGQIKIRRAGEMEAGVIHNEVIAAYVKQLRGCRHLLSNGDTTGEESGWPGDLADLVPLLSLPGAVADPAAIADGGALWADVAATVEEAVGRLDAMRKSEGAAMASSLHELLDQLEHLGRTARARAPSVADAYRERLSDRVGALMEKVGAQVEPVDLVREVALFAERSDVSEEIVRLGSHFEQFRQGVDSPEGSGRKLDFLVQEMVRETNTMGAKANDIELTNAVVEMKAIIERMRELIQNVE